MNLFSGFSGESTSAAADAVSGAWSKEPMDALKSGIRCGMGLIGVRSPASRRSKLLPRSPYSCASRRASSGRSLMRLARSRGNSGEGVGGSRSAPASGQPDWCLLTAVGVAAGTSGSVGVGGTVLLVKGLGKEETQGDWKGVGSGRSRGRRGTVKDEVERKVAL